MNALLPLSWDEIHSELLEAYAVRRLLPTETGPVHVCVELADGATLEIISPRPGVFPTPRNLAGCRILILRPLPGGPGHARRF